MLSDTHTSLLATYQQAVSRAENARLTLETVQQTVSRPAGAPAAWIEQRERPVWRTPASPPSGWRTPARKGPREGKTSIFPADTPINKES